MKKILLVDDDPTMLLLLSSILKNTYEIITHKGGDDAVLWLQDGNKPDLIICDIEMPDISGMDVLEYVKESTFYKDIPMIMLSAKKKSSDRIDFFKKGADDYLIKPFNPEELELRMLKLLK